MSYPKIKKLISISLIISLYIFHSVTFGETILYQTSNQFGRMAVVENGNERCLIFGNGNITQSCILLDVPDRLRFDYTKMILGALYLNPTPKKILMIGLGGGSLARAIKSILPQAKFEIVEINPALPRVAQKYFMFEEGKNIKVIVEDGVEFINKSKPNIYDLIILDGFGEDYIPPDFLTKEFVEKAKKSLTARGIIAVNTFVRSKFHDTENELYQGAFGSYYNLVSEGNRIILVKKDGLPNKETIEKNAEKWAFSFIFLGIDKNWLLEKFAKID